MPSPQPGLHHVLDCCNSPPLKRARRRLWTFIRMASHGGRYHHRFLSAQAAGIRNSKRLEFEFGITSRRETGFTPNPSQRPQCGGSIKTVPKRWRHVNGGSGAGGCWFSWPLPNGDFQDRTLERNARGGDPAAVQGTVARHRHSVARSDRKPEAVVEREFPDYQPRRQ